MASDAAIMPRYPDRPATDVSFTRTTPFLHTLNNDKDDSPRESVETSSLPPAISAHVHVPAEIWSMTLNQISEMGTDEDLAYLWMTVRRVSRLFRDDVERFFRKDHLHKMELFAHCCKCSLSD